MTANSFPRRLFFLFALLFALGQPVRAQTEATTTTTITSRGVSSADCFPLERLPETLRGKAEATLLKLLDSEALYTIVGGMKPMSSGFVQLNFDTQKPDVARIEELRQIFSTFHCGDSIMANLLPFHIAQKNKRYAEGVVFHRPAVRAMVAKYADFFAPYGVTASTPPMDIVLIVEHDSTTARNRGLGYLYGYPKRAVDFFVEAQDEMGKTKKLVPRDFFQIPTFGRETGSFVYALPKGAKVEVEDEALKSKAARILSEYRKRRKTYIGKDKADVAALLRGWFKGADGLCAPENATF